LAFVGPREAGRPVPTTIVIRAAQTAGFERFSIGGRMTAFGTGAYWGRSPPSGRGAGFATAT
jgi:hypothetical protein